MVWNSNEISLLYSMFILNWSLAFKYVKIYIHSSVSYRWNADGMYVLLCAPWCGVEAPWVSQAMGVGVVFPVLPVVWRVRLCRRFLAGRIFDHGGVRAGFVCPTCQVVWCVGPVWGVSVGWSAEVRPNVVLVARSEDLFVRAGFCCKRCRFFHNVWKSGGRQTMSVCSVFQYFW
jgi:hypothetical protein